MPPIFHFDIFIFGFLCRCVLSPAGWAPTQSMPRWPRSVGLAGWFSNLNEDKLNIFCKGWRREKSWGRERFLRKCRRERESCWKTAVHKYTPAYRCLILCLKTTDKKIAIEFVDSSTYLKLAPKHFCLSARVGVPATILAFSALYWGYGLSKYQEWSTTI